MAQELRASEFDTIVRRAFHLVHISDDRKLVEDGSTTRRASVPKRRLTSAWVQTVPPFHHLGLESIIGRVFHSTFREWHLDSPVRIIIERLFVCTLPKALV